VPSLGAALLAVQGIGTALYARERTGSGQQVSTSLLAGALAFQPGIVSMSGGFPLGSTVVAERRPHGIQPFYSIYECADGEWLHFGCLSVQFQQRAAAAIELTEELSALGFGTPSQRENGPTIIAAIRERMKQRPFADWVMLFEERDVPYARAQWTEEIFDDPQVLHEGLIADFDDPTTGAVIQQMASVLGGPAGSWRQPPACPTPGQHTDEICRELGLGGARIDELRRAGVIA
jgi:formyl-CoA transferase